MGAFLATRERRELDGVVVDDRRLDEPRLDEVTECVVDELAPRVVSARVHLTLLEPAAEVIHISCPDILFFQGIDELDPPPRSFEVGVVATEGDLRRPDRVLGDPRDKLLDSNHRILVSA